MKKIGAWIMCLFLITCIGAVEIERYDDRGSIIVPEDTVIEKLADGFSWVEGPAWNAEEESLIFSDIPQNVILKWKENEGVSVFMEKSGYNREEPFLGREPGSNGLAYTKNGEILICEHGNRRVTRLGTDGTKTIIADHYQDKRLNSPNDVIEAPNGDILFTDPPYGLKDGFEDAEKELSFQGVYLQASGELTLLTDEIKAPNGLGISPDGKTLYISNSDPELPVWYALDFDGKSVKNPRILADASPWIKDRKGLPDGFTINQEGYLFAAGPGGLYVIAPDGIIIAFLDFGHPVSNCTWGDGQNVLYVTAEHSIYRITFQTKDL